jgi:hypothetical protein
LHLLEIDEYPHGSALVFTSAELGACLARQLQLQSLCLYRARDLTSLSFLTEGSLPRTLTALNLQSFEQRLPVSEIKHVLQLRRLRSLDLSNVFDAPLGAAVELLF